MSSIDLGTALANLDAAVPSLTLLITAVSYTLGVAFVTMGLFGFKGIASQTLSSAQRGEVAGPFVKILVGCILVYFPSTLSTGLTSIFGTNTIGSGSDFIAYVGVSSSDNWQNVSIVVIDYVTLVGYIAFVRGWVILSKLGASGAQPGSMGKGLLHVIGGILLVNIVYTFEVLANTFGFTAQ